MLRKLLAAFLLTTFTILGGAGIAAAEFENVAAPVQKGPLKPAVLQFNGVTTGVDKDKKPTVSILLTAPSEYDLASVAMNFEISGLGLTNAVTGSFPASATGKPGNLGADTATFTFTATLDPTKVVVTKPGTIKVTVIGTPELRVQATQLYVAASIKSKDGKNVTEISYELKFE